MPAADEQSAQVAVTGLDGEVSAEALWKWLTASYPIEVMPPLEFMIDSLPRWEREDLERRFEPLLGQRWTRGAEHGDN
jgi:hypothetical protein